MYCTCTFVHRCTTCKIPGYRHAYLKHLRTDDTFPTFSLKRIFQPPPFEEFLEINFQFSTVSILHTSYHDRRQFSG
jgi:hypothetical protein